MKTLISIAVISLISGCTSTVVTIPANKVLLPEACVVDVGQPNESRKLRYQKQCLISTVDKHNSRLDCEDADCLAN